MLMEHEPERNRETQVAAGRGSLYLFIPFSFGVKDGFCRLS